MKCLIVTTQASPETQQAYHVASCRMALAALGIQFKRLFVNALGSLANISANYDFILIPQMDSALYASNIINQSAITIPVFSLGIAGGSGSAVYGNTPGVSGTVTGVVEGFVTPTWSTSRFWGHRGRSFTPAGGTAIKTVSATSPIDESPQTNAGNLVEWRTTKVGAGGVYVSLDDLAYLNPLAELIQVAYNAGDFTTDQMATLRRAPVVFDIDHINDPTWDTNWVAHYAAANIANFDRAMAAIPSGGVVWCGIGNGDDGYITNMGAVLKSRLQEQSGKKLRYSYHTHSAARGQPVTGTWPNIVNVKTKTEQHDYYETDKGLWEAAGLTFHTPAYYNNGSYAWNDDTLALFSEDVSVASSPGNNVSESGFGFRVFRGAATSSRKIPITASGTKWENAHAVKKMMRGILMVPVQALNTGVPMNTLTHWLTCVKYIHSAVNQGATLYLHGYDWKTPQAPTTDYPGDEIMLMLNDLRLRTKDVTHFFANPLDYWAGRSAGQNPA